MLRGVRVLVVDDEPNVAKSVRALLIRKGHQVALAEDGAEAVAAVARCHFDLVLMDVRMPVMDGVTALKHIRAMDSGPAVILMTAWSAPDLIESAQRSGASAVLPKPLDLPRFFEMVAAFSARPSVLLIGLSTEQEKSTREALLSRGVAVRSLDAAHAPETALVGVDGVIADPLCYSLAPGGPAEALRQSNPHTRFARLVGSSEPDGCQLLEDPDALARWIDQLT